MKKPLPEKKPDSLKEICERVVSEDVGGKYHAARQRLIKLVKSGKISVAEIDRQLQEQIWLLAILADLFQSHPKELGSLTSENRSDAVRSLGSIGRIIVTILDAQAKKKDVDAAEALWDIASNSAQQVGVLADLHPELLRARARKSEYMPSRRARIKKFTDNFKRRADAIELSADSAINIDEKAQYDLNSPATEFVKELLDKAKFNRQLIRQATSVQHMLKQIDVKTWIPAFLGVPPEEAAVFLDIPPYSKKSAKLWLDRIVNPCIDRPQTLEKLKFSNKAFYDYLEQKAKKATNNSIREQLKKVCRYPVLHSLAPDAVSDVD